MLRPVLLCVAVVAAAGAAILARQQISASEQRLEAQAAALLTTDVLVITGDLEIGQTVSSRNLKWQPWPAENLNPAYVMRTKRADAIADLTGAAARQPLFAGEPVTEKKLVKREQGGVLSVVVDDGYRAITMKVDEAQGLAGLVVPGDRVDVILTHRVQAETASGSTKEHGVAETIVRDVRVLGVGQEIRSEDDAKKPAKSITLEVGPSDAEAISLGRSIGTLSLTLRSAFNEKAESRRVRTLTREGDISGASSPVGEGQAGPVVYRGARRTSPSN